LYDGDQVKLSDFGESLNIPPQKLEESESGFMFEEINGSMLWMAPEIFLEKPRGCRSDIWSLGCTVIELLTAKNPWP
jgi:serine/threonine protein kinase